MTEQVIVRGRNTKIKAVELVANITESFDEPVVVTVSPYELTRKDVQNNLMWHWNNLVGKHVGESANYIHGQSKLEVLQPILRGSEKYFKVATFDQDLIDSLPEYEYKIKAAYGVVRTKRLTVKEMSEYLRAYQLYWSVGSGVHFPETKRIDGHEE